MKPSEWPHEMDVIRAKSADRGGDTLAQHTWDVLEKLAALRDLRPTLPALVHAPGLWRWLFWTCLFHDFGKAAQGFQAMLRGGELWRERHEVLSLACFDWIAGGLSEAEQRYVVAAIVSHHKDARVIRTMYDDLVPDPLMPLVAQLDERSVSQLWHWVNRCAQNWQQTLGFAVDELSISPLMPHDEAVALVCDHGHRRVRHWLRLYQDWLDELEFPAPAPKVVLPILLRGLTTTADHLASAHVTHLANPIQESWTALASRILKPGQTIYAHQELSASYAGQSALLVAPTGSGKTEAALYWAVGDGKQPIPRLFYTLPYQASMNAMFDRLRDKQRGFGRQAIGLQHGRAMQALYTRLMNQEGNAHSAAGTAAWERNLNGLHARPVKVFSPYQMLKAAFQLRGFEAMLTDYAQAAFIFDEIHAYEPERLALILALMKYLRTSYGARFFVMSATFPQIIRERLSEALGVGTQNLVQADAELYRRFTRHQLHLLSGGLLENGIDRIVADVRAGKSVLACVNTVRRAQEVSSALRQAGMPADKVIMIHSRYIVRDRTNRERTIIERCPPGGGGTPVVIVATQVVEVSLNIDLDTIYTDPAPLEALLQRFGRVNRIGAKDICPVYVYRQPDDGQYVYGRDTAQAERGHIVRVTLAELEQHDGEIIDESATGAWLDRIYADAILRSEWEQAYRTMAIQADMILRDLRPFNSDPQREDEFEQMFDGIDVLPHRFEQQYVAHLMADDFIEASQYLVNISSRKYRALARQGVVLPITDADGKRHKWMVRLPYSEENGLSFDLAAGGPDFD